MDGADKRAERRERRSPRPLDDDKLRELALFYVGRFATTRAKLRTYLTRKVRERGWAGDSAPDIVALAERLGELGYINDQAFATAKAGALTARGLGGRRVRQALTQAGVGEHDAEEGLQLAEAGAAESALEFARRKRIGPFAAGRPDPIAREKALAAMVRAGHSFALARRIIETEPGAEPDLDI